MYKTCRVYQAKLVVWHISDLTIQLPPFMGLAWCYKLNLYGISVVWQFSHPQVWDLHRIPSWTCCMAHRWFDDSVIPKYGTYMVPQAELVIWYIRDLTTKNQTCMVFQAKLLVWHICVSTTQLSESRRLAWYSKPDLLYGTSVLNKK